MIVAVESSMYWPELVAMKIAMDLIVALRIQLKKFGLQKTYVFSNAICERNRT